jgi:DNA-binding transcriptional LysR family regulator
VVTLTEAGLDFLALIEPLLDEAERAVRRTGELRGVLRIGLPTIFPLREVIPPLSVFMNGHPAPQIDLMMEDQRQDLVTDVVDAALRFGPLTDST